MLLNVPPIAAAAATAGMVEADRSSIGVGIKVQTASLHRAPYYLQANLSTPEKHSLVQYI